MVMNKLQVLRKWKERADQPVSDHDDWKADLLKDILYAIPQGQEGIDHIRHEMRWMLNNMQANERNLATCNPIRRQLKQSIKYYRKRLGLYAEVLVDLHSWSNQGSFWQFCVFCTYFKRFVPKLAV
jgi:hypothetical protein